MGPGVRATFTTFLVGWAIQGFYVVWLPLEIAIIHRRTAGTGRQALLTRRAAAFLVAALELAVIVGALTSGALVESTSMTVLLALPAIAVTLCFVVIWFGVEDAPGESTGGMDLGGLALVTTVLGLVMGGLILVRLEVPGSPLAWLLIALGLLAFVPFVRFELAHEEPLIDVRLLAHARAVAGAADGVPVRHVGARRADPAVDLRAHRPGRGGLRARRDAGFVSTLIGVYVLVLAVGAFTLPLAARLIGARGALVRPACWSRSATRCCCRSTTRPRRHWSTWRSPASARAPWWRRSPPPRRRPRRPSGPASRPA